MLVDIGFKLVTIGAGVGQVIGWPLVAATAVGFVFSTTNFKPHGIVPALPAVEGVTRFAVRTGREMDRHRSLTKIETMAIVTRLWRNTELPRDFVLMALHTLCGAVSSPQRKGRHLVIEVDRCPVVRTVTGRTVRFQRALMSVSVAGEAVATIRTEVIKSMTRDTRSGRMSPPQEKGGHLVIEMDLLPAARRMTPSAGLFQFTVGRSGRRRQDGGHPYQVQNQDSRQKRATHDRNHNHRTPADNGYAVRPADRGRTCDSPRRVRSRARHRDRIAPGRVRRLRA